MSQEVRIEVPHTCPKCGVVATTEAEVKEIFGLRNMGNGTTINQSWCKECR